MRRLCVDNLLVADWRKNPVYFLENFSGWLCWHYTIFKNPDIILIYNDKYYCVNEYTTYCVNKTEFYCALSFHWFSSSLSSIFLSFSAPYYPASSCIFFLFLFLYPCRSWTSYLSRTSRFSNTSALRGSVETYPSKSHFYFTRLVNILKHLHCN